MPRSWSQHPRRHNGTAISLWLLSLLAYYLPPIPASPPTICTAMQQVRPIALDGVGRDCRDAFGTLTKVQDNILSCKTVMMTPPMERSMIPFVLSMCSRLLFFALCGKLKGYEARAVMQSPLTASH